MILVAILALLFQVGQSTAIAPTPTPADGSQQADGKDEDWGIDDYLDASQKPAPLDPAAANRAAIERAEAAARDSQTAGEWPEDEGKMKCRQTTTGFACGSSQEAIDQQEEQMRRQLAKPD